MSTAHIPTIEPKARFASQFQYAIIAAVVMSICPLRTLAQDHDHAMAMQQQLTPDQKRQQGALLQRVREATERFKDVGEAEYEHYSLNFGCVSGPDLGAMGLHYVNFELVGSGVIDPAHPQIILYEPTPNGRAKLTGADYLVDAAQWDSDPKHKGQPPELMGQLFHYFEAPNRFRLNPFYTLHVWAWKDNPSGAFANWNPNVSCASYVGPTNNDPQ